MHKSFDYANNTLQQAQSIVGGATHGQVVLRCIRKQTELVTGSKAVSMSSALTSRSPALTFLNYKLQDDINSFLPNVLLVIDFIAAVETLKHRYSYGPMRMAMSCGPWELQI